MINISSLKNGEMYGWVKISSLRFWRQRKLAAVNPLPLHEKHSSQSSERTLGPFLTLWPRCNNPFNLQQTSILKKNFPYSRRRRFFNFLIKVGNLWIQLTSQLLVICPFWRPLICRKTGPWRWLGSVVSMDQLYAGLWWRNEVQTSVL